MTEGPLEPESSHGHVFVSYARKDQSAVDKLVAALERRGERVWLEDPAKQNNDPSLTDEQIAFIRASLAARKRRIIGSVFALALGVVIALVALDQYRQAQARERIASAERIASQAHQTLGESGQDLLKSTVLAMQSLGIAETEAGTRVLKRNLSLLPESPAALADFEEPIRSLAFSPDGKKLVIGTETKGARLCDVAARECTHTLNVPRAVRHIQFSDDGRYVFMVGVEAVVWDLNDLDEPLFRIGDVREQAHAYAVSPDFRFVAVGDQSGYGEIRSVTGGERHLLAFDGTAFAMAFNQDGKLFASLSDQEVVLSEYEPNMRGAPTQWHVGRIRLEKKSHVRLAAFLPGTRQLATGWAHQVGGTVLVSEAATEASPTESNVREIRRFPLGSPPRSLAISSDAALLATGEESGRVRIWRTRPQNDALSRLSARELVRDACGRLPARMRDNLRADCEPSVSGTRP